MKKMAFQITGVKMNFLINSLKQVCNHLEKLNYIYISHHTVDKLQVD